MKGRTPSRDASPGRLAAQVAEKCGGARFPRRSGGPSRLMDEPGRRSSVTRARDEPEPPRERERGESQPHFSRLRSFDTGSSYGEARQSAEGATAAGLPTEGSHSEMAFGPLARLDPLLVDARALECARCARLPGVRTTTAGDRDHGRG